MSTLRPVLSALAAEWFKGARRKLLCPFTLAGLSQIELRMGKLYRPVAVSFGWPQFPSDKRRNGQEGAPCHSKPCAHWEALQQHADKQGAVNEDKQGAANDDDDDDDQSEVQSSKCHRLLAEVMRGIRDAPVTTLRGKADPRVFDVTIPWPPLLLVEGLKKDDAGQELSSSGLLLKAFGVHGVCGAFPIFRGPFRGQAVLQFAASKEGLERAKNFLDNSSADLRRDKAGAFNARWASLLEPMHACSTLHVAICPAHCQQPSRPLGWPRSLAGPSVSCAD